MFLSDVSIKRPVFATVLMLALVTLGVFSYRRLAIDMFPDIEIPVLSIITQYPGAAPETVEREVTKKLEQAVNPIAGVKHVYSTSREGLSTVIVEFNLEVKINDVSQEARAKINGVRRELPEGMKEPVIQKFDFNAMPVVSLSVRSTFLPCTPYGVMRLLEHYGVDLKGKKAVIVGKSLAVGKPLAMMMLAKEATVTVCHKETKDLGAETRMADILCTATGRPGLIKEDMVKEGAVVVDIGINILPDGATVGDVDFEGVSRKTSLVTPVPGGVGPVTIAILLKNTVISAKRMVGVG